MTDGPGPEETGPIPSEEMAEPKPPRDPASTLTSAMVVYIFINFSFALPLVIFPTAYFDFIGLDETVADTLGGLRWVGAMLLAWSITAIAVMARPEGRGVFVTTGATQLTLGALAFLYSISVGEHDWHTWYQWFGALILTGGAVYLWWARLSGRKVLKGASGATETTESSKGWFRR